jgi:uncharacterized membrane protein
MQAGLALVGSLLGIASFAMSGGWLWLIGALVLVSAWPYTLIVIKPTNDALNAADAATADAEARRLVETWGRLHAGRSGIGVAATLIYLWAASRRIGSRWDHGRSEQRAYVGCNRRSRIAPNTRKSAQHG